MGNVNQSQINQQKTNIQKLNLQNNTGKKIEIKNNNKIPLKEEEIFNKISTISNDLLIEFNNDFLKDNFCSQVSLIFEKKLSHLSIKLLKTIYNNINQKNVNKELLMTLQYLPKNDEKFEDLNNFFQENLRENFWNKNIKVNIKQFLTGNNIKLNAIQTIKFTPNYIDINHVNDLLNSIVNTSNNTLNTNQNLNRNKNNNNDTTDNTSNNNKLENKVGGYFNKNKKFINKYKKEEQFNNKINKNNTSNNKNNKNNEINEINENNKINLNNISNNNISNNNISNNNISNNNISNNNKINKNKINKNNINKNIYNKTNDKANLNIDNKKGINNILTKKTIDIENQGKKNNKINNRKNNVNNTEYKNGEQKNTNNKIIKMNISKPSFETPVTIKPENISEIRQNIKNMQNIKNKFNEKKIQNKVNTVIEKAVNLIPQKTEELKNNIIEETFKKYYVPKSYKYPIPLCNNKSKCKLTKKQLCQGITENLIVRNNIIAAILTTIPYKNKKGEYIGGICYQKFVNLDKCKVCVPYDFKNLKNQSMNIVLTKILQKADNLTFQDCKNNDGYFLELTQQQKEILGKKLENMTENEAKNNPQIKYNLFFIQFTNKLKNVYFQNLVSLIQILEVMQNNPVINNSTLNKISFETKKIIDNMYSLVHYYYIFAIISLINSDVTETFKKENKLQNFVSKAL